MFIFNRAVSFFLPFVSISRTIFGRSLCVYERNFCQKFLGGAKASYYSQRQTDSCQDEGEGGREGGRGDPMGTLPDHIIQNAAAILGKL